MIARRTLLSGVVSLGIAMTVEAAVPDGGPEAPARAFVDAWNAHDMIAMEAVLSADAHWVNVVGMYWKGRDRIMFAQRFFHAGIFRHNQQELQSVQTRMLSPDIALVMLDCLQDEYQTPSGHVMPQALDRLSLVVVRQPTGWRISHGQNTIVDARAATSDPVLHMPKG
ncbi:MAG: SgcJ/EcaC family oxidoreductase [Janthinobacterium lividum]